MELVENFKIEDLDQIKIFDDEGSIGACLGMMFTFYLHKTHEKTIRQKMVSVIEEYCAMAGDKLKWYLRPTGGKYVEIKKNRTIPSISEHLEKNHSITKGYSWTFSGGEHYTDAAPYGIEMMSLEDFGTDDLGCVSGNLPMAWIAKNGPGSFQKLMHKWCAELRPFHGYAGLGIIQSMDYDQNRRTKRLVYPYAIKFPGLEVENTVTLSIQLSEKIKGVNWLTALSDGLIKKLGSIETLKKKLGNDFPFYTYDGGCLIQAGPSPQIGDRNRRVIPKHYQILARALKPIRVDHAFSYLNTGDMSENKSASLKWLNRFD